VFKKVSLAITRHMSLENLQQTGACIIVISTSEPSFIKKRRKKLSLKGLKRIVVSSAENSQKEGSQTGGVWIFLLLVF